MQQILECVEVVRNLARIAEVKDSGVCRGGQLLDDGGRDPAAGLELARTILQQELRVEDGVREQDDVELDVWVGGHDRRDTRRNSSPYSLPSVGQIGANERVPVRSCRQHLGAPIGVTGIPNATFDPLRQRGAFVVGHHSVAMPWVMAPRLKKYGACAIRVPDRGRYGNDLPRGSPNAKGSIPQITWRTERVASAVSSTARCSSIVEPASDRLIAAPRSASRYRPNGSYCWSRCRRQRLVRIVARDSRYLVRGDGVEVRRPARATKHRNGSVAPTNAAVVPARALATTATSRGTGARRA